MANSFRFRNAYLSTVTILRSYRSCKTSCFEKKDTIIATLPATVRIGHNNIMYNIVVSTYRFCRVLNF